MKWWGWGDLNKEFDNSDKPELWPFIKDAVGLVEEPRLSPPIDLDSIELPEPKIIPWLTAETSKLERLTHAYGKSFRDLWRIRHGIMDGVPDAVIYPDSEDDIKSVISLAHKQNFVVIPFGGGSNIAGCLEARWHNNRPVVSLDLRKLNRVLEVDRRSMTARIQAGAMGPELERQLNAQGFTLGHFPDSFEYSSFGGWIATRSAGMQSDKYGKIEDMVLSLRMVTPSGIIVTRTVPKSSNGIDVKHLCIGSEGILGVITEATVRVHRCPEKKDFYGYLFPDLESGVEAIYECVQQGCSPLVTRLNDAGKTALSFAYKTQPPPLKELMGKLVKKYLAHVKRFDLTKVCLMIVAFEGDKKAFATQRSQVDAIYKKHGAFALGTDAGRAFERGKYDFPYLRDFVMDRNITADVSESATVWSNLLPMYHATTKAIEDAIANTGSKPWVGCHISHTYPTGASLYFTFGCLQKNGHELEQYQFIKKAAEDAFMANGATLSHHHAVGYEHMPWLEDDISPTGITAIKALKSGIDPHNIMNPGKIVPALESGEGAT